MVLVRSSSVSPYKRDAALGRSETVLNVPGTLVRQISLPSVTTRLNTYKTYWPGYRQQISNPYRYYNSYSYYDDYWYNKYRYLTPYWSFYKAKPQRLYHVPTYCYQPSIDYTSPYSFSYRSYGRNYLFY